MIMIIDVYETASTSMKQRYTYNIIYTLNMYIIHAYIHPIYTCIKLTVRIDDHVNSYNNVSYNCVSLMVPSQFFFLVKYYLPIYLST